MELSTNVIIGLVSSIISATIFLFFFRGITATRGMPGILSFFFFKFFLSIFIGSLALNTFDFGYSRKDILLSMCLAASACSILMLLGAQASNTLFRYSNRKLDFSLIPEAVNNIKPVMVFSICSLILLISIFTLVEYRSRLGLLPIEILFSGDSSRIVLASLRSDATSGFGGNYHWFQLAMKTLPVYLLVLTFFLKELGKKWKLVFALTLSLVIIVSVKDLQKNPIIELLILLTVCQIVLKNKINKKLFFRISIFAIGLIILMYMYFMGLADRGVSAIAEYATERVFIKQVTPFYHYFLYQEDTGFLFGKSLPNPAGIFPFQNVPLTKEIALHMWGKSDSMIGSAPTVFYGDWYVNFGLPGMVLSMVFLGAFLQMCDIIFSILIRKYKNIFIISLYIFLIIYFSRYALTTFVNLPFDIVIYATTLLTLVFSLFASKKQPKITL